MKTNDRLQRVPEVYRSRWGGVVEVSSVLLLVAYFFLGKAWAELRDFAVPRSVVEHHGLAYLNQEQRDQVAALVRQSERCGIAIGCLSVAVWWGFGKHQRRLAQTVLSLKEQADTAARRPDERPSGQPTDAARVIPMPRGPYPGPERA